MISDAFAAAVRSLNQPDMGTELAAPLLYQLLRTTRAANVLEVGAGYTTPFIAQALADNAADMARERRAFAAKAPLLGEDSSAWMLAEPALGDPRFHLVERDAGKLTTIDDGREHGLRGIARVRRILRRLGLLKHVDFRVEDFVSAGAGLRAEGRSFDFIWFDCGGYAEYRNFLDLYLPMISREGGLLALHYMLTNIGPGTILRELKLRQATTDFNEFELLSLLEPHKFSQNSVTLLRFHGKWRERLYEDNRLDVFLDAARLAEQNKA